MVAFLQIIFICKDSSEIQAPWQAIQEIFGAREILVPLKLHQ